MTTRLVSLVGLGFGDCGKGLFADFLTRHWQAHTVVRFNGGAQAGHNVVLPDRRHHTFSQFGAGTFVPGVFSVLAFPVVVHPTALLMEHAALQRLGVQDALDRLLIDARCRINTPFHQAAGRLREWLRGTDAHGSCGVGMGETVRHGLEHPDHILRYGDLQNRQRAEALLANIRRTLWTEFQAVASNGNARIQEELDLLSNPAIEHLWLTQCDALIRACAPASNNQIGQRLRQPGTVLFEGAQGMLLDEWHGFHPHTTWSSVGTAAARHVAQDAGWTGPMTHLGILRTYVTRHGVGPFPTHDLQLDCLVESHNTVDGWQGSFRRGHPDAVLLRYALANAGALDGLLVSHLDVFEKIFELRWCQNYRLISSPASSPYSLEELPIPFGKDLQHQQALTALLNQATPNYATTPINSDADFFTQLRTLTKLPVWFGSYGPTHQDVQAINM